LNADADTMLTGGEAFPGCGNLWAARFAQSPPFRRYCSRNDRPVSCVQFDLKADAE
jgi:hypothetical protein